jgi:hypothetical protein
VERSLPPRFIASPIVPNYRSQNAVGVSLFKEQNLSRRSYRSSDGGQLNTLQTAVLSSYTQRVEREYGQASRLISTS